MLALDGPHFFRLAHRVAAYQGVMAVRIANQQQDTTPGPSGPTPGVQQIESTKGALTAAAGDLFDFN